MIKGAGVTTTYNVSKESWNLLKARMYKCSKKQKQLFIYEMSKEASLAKLQYFIWDLSEGVCVNLLICSSQHICLTALGSLMSAML